ncbi:MAG: tetratricopeptide repeat protein [Bacteroidia bacterium]|nr:tetratricopeptide repeat protein [Bacteroidia bacterium]
MKIGLKYFTVILFLLTTHCAFSQSDKKLLRDGNKLFQEKKYSDAEVAYKKSLNKNQKSYEGNFNLGDAYYKQGKFDEAAKQFESVQSQKSSDKNQAAALHNLGNTFLQNKKYEESIEAFKQSLKMNPKDNDTRYNLAYAQSMLKQQQQQQQQNQNKNKDKKDNKQNQDKQQQQQKENKEDQKQQQKQQQQKKQEISKEDAERILQALNNDEKNKHKKAKQVETGQIDIEKDW